MTWNTVATLAWISLGCAALGLLGGCGSETKAQSAGARFEHLIVDANGPQDPWGKTIGDLNGDGRPDIVVGGRAGGGLVWYENPGWRKHVIASTGAFSTDLEVADVDGDGRNDVVSLQYDRLVWFRNGDWAVTVIDERKLHDVEVADLDGDGRIDVVARGQSAFRGRGDQIFLYFQDQDGQWTRRVLDAPEGEGLKLADLDRDSRPDIVVNGFWYRNPGQREAAWSARQYTHTWTWPHTSVAVDDISGDARPDIVLAPAERAGERYRVSWFEAPVEPADGWVEHVVDPDVEAVHHFVGTADMDLDGRVDIVSAKMHQGRPPNEVKVYFNLGEGRAWSKQVIATTGSHSMRLVDIDGDGDADLFGANWSGDHQPVELWLNQTCSQGSTGMRWRRHVIDERRPWQAVFVAVADLDDDGRRDVAAGGWWYRNPGRAEGSWERRAFGAGANNVAWLADLDADGDIDVLASRWKGDRGDRGLVWAENDGRGEFRVHTNIPDADGDFLQGVAAGHFTSADRQQVALSWHVAGKGIQLLTIPARPAEQWRWERISELSQDEALTAGDIDRDGKLDLLLGTRWLRNGGSSWPAFVIEVTAENPDRNRLADINGDGRLDAVVGFEAISRPGAIVWYEQGLDAVKPWKRHLIGTVIGPMSLDVADIDGDGDLDVVVGEHNLKDSAAARLLIFENADSRGENWREHVVYTGDEHHDGALVADLDGDGDLDIVSMGWGHDRVVWYENLAARCSSSQAPHGAIGKPQVPPAARVPRRSPVSTTAMFSNRAGKQELHMNGWLP
jgi:hypothetical protein